MPMVSPRSRAGCADMMVKPGHPHVTSDGYVKIPYTSEWRQVRACAVKELHGAMMLNRCFDGRTTRWWSWSRTCARSLAICRPCSAVLRISKCVSHRRLRSRGFTSRLAMLNRRRRCRPSQRQHINPLHSIKRTAITRRSVLALLLLSRCLVGRRLWQDRRTGACCSRRISPARSSRSLRKCSSVFEVMRKAPLRVG